MPGSPLQLAFDALLPLRLLAPCLVSESQVLKVVFGHEIAIFAMS